MPNPDFKVRIMEQKCKHEPDVFYYICECFIKSAKKDK